MFSVSLIRCLSSQRCADVWAQQFGDNMSSTEAVREFQAKERKCRNQLKKRLENALSRDLNR